MQLIQRVSAIFLVVGFITTCLTKQVRTESQSHSRIYVKENNLEKQIFCNTDLNTSGVFLYC